MALATQVKLLRAVREMLMGDSRSALAGGSQPKPDFKAGVPPIPLPRSMPEQQGLSSAMLAGYYRQMAALPSANLHALLVLRGGHVVAEGYFAPFRREVWHVTHSLCKTLVGAAVGMAIDEELFGLDDAVVGYFGKEAGLLPSRQLKSLTVRHLLTMSSGISFDEISEAVETNWLKGIFSAPLAFAPGERFVYNSMNSHLLAALVCRTSGEGLVEYLTPRLLAPMGFGAFAWEQSPQGIEKGGWGAYMMVEDMAKLGQLYLQKGRWTVAGKARQLVPAAWVQYTTSHLMQGDGALGYGGQCWVDEASGSYTMNGMFGQYVTVFPAQDVVVVMTSGCPRIFADSDAYDLTVATFGQKPLSTVVLPPAPRAAADLARVTAGLQFRQAAPAPVVSTLPLRWRQATGRPHRWQVGCAAGACDAGHTPALAGGIPAEAQTFCGVAWSFPESKAGILPIVIQAMNNNFTAGVRAVQLWQSDGVLHLTWEEGNGSLTLPVGFGKGLERLIHVGRESFLVATRARLARNEDDEAVLVVEVCFLEHSSLRILKLQRLEDGQLLLRMDEQPQFQRAIEAAVHQSETTAAQGDKQNSLGELIKGSDFIGYRIRQLCTPELLGVPVGDEQEDAAPLAEMPDVPDQAEKAPG